jgi:RNA polymerase sigma-70 factor (ECF subfamily)
MQAISPDIFELIKNSDRNAYEQLFKMYYTPLVSFARNIIRDTDAAEDLVQEVFVKIWERKHTIEIKTSVKAYLYMAVKNHCLNKLKTEQRNAFLNDEMADDVRVATNNTEEYSNTIELSKHIDNALNLLPPKCAVIFKMSRFEDKTYKEIAESLELSVKTVENQMGKALSIMRGALSPYLNQVYLWLTIFFIKW